MPIPVVSGPQIAAAAARWVGQGYQYEGDASSPGRWDCSSFASFVLGHELGLALPGGSWGSRNEPPNAHGDVVTDYATWRGAQTVPGPPQPGDLCIWVGSGTNGHIGIAQSATTMVSALNSQYGTARTPIAGYGPAGAPLVYRRLLGVPAGASAPGTSARTLIGLPIEVLLALLTAGAEVVGLVLVGAAVALGVGYFAVHKLTKAST